MVIGIDRRVWLGLCSLAAIVFPIGLVAGGPQSLPESRPLVATPALRAEYLKGMLDALCTQIGVRVAGSPGDQKGALLIEREMRRALPVVHLDTFTFRRWEPVGAAEFEVDGRALETYIYGNSPGTPPDGVGGILMKSATSPGAYEVVDGPSGTVKARIYVSEFARAYPGLYAAQDGIPEFGVGKQDRPRLDSALEQRLPVRARGQIRWVEGARTSNVVGTLQGQSSDEILITAHADTKYSTPGANDNTASMITMLMLAHAMSGTRPARTVTFVATTGEELGGNGAQHYAQVRKEQGTLRHIRVCLNFDSLTWGPNLQITSTDRALVQMIADIHSQLGRDAPKVFNTDDTMDSAPFHEAGARTVHFNSRGDDARTLPLYHRPEDRAETVNPAFVEGSFQVLRELIQRLEAEPW